MQYRPLNANIDRALLSDSVYCHWRQWVSHLAGVVGYSICALACFFVYCGHNNMLVSQ